MASAVVKTHPDEALTIWKTMALAEINRVSPSAYVTACAYLKKMRSVYQRENRLREWTVLIETLRAEHKRKRRLMEELDRLERGRGPSKRILDG